MSLIDEIRKSLGKDKTPMISEKSKELQGLSDKVNRELLSLLTHPERQDAGALSNFVTYSRRLKDKLVNFAALDAADNNPKGGAVDSVQIENTTS